MAGESSGFTSNRGRQEPKDLCVWRKMGGQGADGWAEVDVSERLSG